MKIYLAARYARMAEMAEIAKTLTEKGHIVTSQWVTGKEEATGMTRQEAALMDVADVRRADVLVFFAEPHGSANIGGGRHWEFGYAYGRLKPCYVVGEAEQVFCELPEVTIVPDLDALLEVLP